MHEQSQSKAFPNLSLNITTEGNSTSTGEPSTPILPFHYVTQNAKNECADFVGSGIGEAAAVVGNFIKMLRSAWDHSENEQERLCK